MILLFLQGNSWGAKQNNFVKSIGLAYGLTHPPVLIGTQVGDDYARIVVNAQKKQLARSGSAAGSTRRGPQTQREQSGLRPSTAGTAPVPTVDAFTGAAVASAAEARQGGAEI